MPRAKTTGKQVSFKIAEADMRKALLLLEELRLRPDMEHTGLSQTSVFRMAMARGLKELENEYLTTTKKKK
jgi:hypothetical protein